MTLALVQTPVDLGYTAAHGHLLAIVPPPPPSQHHHPLTNTLSPCLHHCYHQDQRGHHHPHPKLEQFQQQQQQQQQCNGFVKIPCSCSVGIGGITDDESSIPTPPPAVSVYPPRDCPIHYLPDRNPYVTVHSPATGSYPPLSSIRRHHNYQKQQSQDRDMPDITAFSRMLVHQRRQFSTDSENSGYKIGVGNSAPIRQQSEPHQTTICYQCHGAGHVALPVASESVRQMPYNSLPRDLTASTVCSSGVPMDIESPEDECEEQHGRRAEEESVFHPRHQRSHSSGTNYHGSLRRITAV